VIVEYEECGKIRLHQAIGTTGVATARRTAPLLCELDRPSPTAARGCRLGTVAESGRINSRR